MRASHTWGPGLRDHFLVHHVISGRGSYTAGGVTHEVGAGDTFIVYPSVIVTYRADDADPWEYCWVGFNGAEAKLLMAQTPFTREKPVVRFEDPGRHRERHHRHLPRLRTTPASELRAIGLLYLLPRAAHRAAGAPAPAAGLSLEYVESAIRFIAHNYSGSIDVSDIAASVGISRSHLYRVFMRHIGTSPNEYLTKFRISQAVELIERSSLPVSAVAASVGYDDSLYFSRVFKKITGVSPSSYIKKSASHAGKAD